VGQPDALKAKPLAEVGRDGAIELHEDLLSKLSDSRGVSAKRCDVVPNAKVFE
jgi:hypothetical protein